MKFLCRRERDEYRFNRLKKGPNVMVSIYSKLYKVSNDVMVKDFKSDDCVAFYNADETQPLMPEPYLVDPDLLIVLMDSAKNSGGRRSIWANITPSKILAWLTPIVVIFALLYGFLLNGGF